MIGTRVDFRLLKIGACYHPEWMAMRGGTWRPAQFPALCALLRHPKRGWMLYDTGYASRFLSATARVPEWFYRALIPVELPAHEQLPVQLHALGIHADDIKTVLISHFHSDHIAGLRDFPRARFIAMQSDTKRALAFSRWRGLLNGFLPALLPEDFCARVSFVEETQPVALPPWMAPFTFGYDIFGDHSMFAVPLPGHSQSQMGLLLRDQGDAIRLLVADACWSMPACREGRLPSPLANLAITDRRQYRATFAGLRTLALREPDICLIPSHCGATWQQLSERARA